MAQRGSLGFCPNRSIIGSGIFTRSLGQHEEGNLSKATEAVDLIVTGLEVYKIHETYIENCAYISLSVLLSASYGCIYTCIYTLLMIGQLYSYRYILTYPSG